MTIAPALAAQLGTLEARAKEQGVPGGILAWWGRSSFPDGLDKAVLTQREWESIYDSMQQASLTRGLLLPLSLVKRASMAARPDEALRIGIMSFDVTTPSAELRRRVVAAAEAGIALDPPPGELASVLSRGRVFAACALMMHGQWGPGDPVVRGRKVSFVLDPGFYFTNAGGRRPDFAEIDCGDGRGMQRITFGETLEAQYAVAGTVTAELACRYGDTTLRSRFSVNVSEGPAAPAPDETWPLTGASGNKGTAYVFRAPGRTGIAYPVIVSEGFPGGYSPDYLYDMFNQHGLLETLRGAGYDVVLLGYSNGLDRIENNAHVAIACIRAAMRRTTNQLVVGGVSMGGLITRYALALMESMGWEHQTRLYLSIDAPHRGSYTNLCAQWFAQYFATSSAAAAVQTFALASPANQQFLATWLDKGVVRESALRKDFVESLAKLGGYPQKPRRIAVASGRGDGKRGHAPDQQALSWTGSPFVSAELRTLSEGQDEALVAKGYSYRAPGDVADTLRFRSDVSWEGAPGGQNVYNQIARDIAAELGCGEISPAVSPTCSVPTVSALDLAISPFDPVPPPGGEASPFHDYICCETNQAHVQFTPAVKDWLVEQLGSVSTSHLEGPT